MKKIILFILISFAAQSQTQIKLKQLEYGPSNAYLPITTGTNNVLTYTNVLPTSAIPSLSYIPTNSTGTYTMGGIAGSPGFSISGTFYDALSVNGIKQSYFHSDPNYINIGLDNSSSNTLEFFNTGQSISGNGSNNTIVINDDITSKGLVYGSDYSGNFTNESLVSKRWVNANFTPTSSLNSYIPYSGASQSFTMGNFNGYANNFASKSNTFTASASTTSLTSLSARIVQLSGATTHTFNLPNATTLFTGFSLEFNNNSTGVLAINDFGGNLVTTVQPGGYCIVFPFSVSTSNGGWDKHFLMPANASYGTSGLVITGNLTASGNATVTGNEKISGNLQIGSSSNTVVVGNTGTIAVISDQLFSVDFSNSIATAIADLTTYYYSSFGYSFTSGFVNNKIRIPYDCTLIGWDYSDVHTVASSSETATLSINGTTNYTMTTALTYTTASLYQSINTTGLNQNFSAGDLENIKLVSPNFATNPTVASGIKLWFIRR